MAQTMTPEQAAEKARELLDARVDKVQALTSAGQRLEEAQAALDASSKSYAQTWADAERAGWTVAELRQFGLSEPNRKRPGRPRKTTTATQRGSEAGGESTGPQV